VRLEKGKLYRIVYVNPNGSGANNLCFESAVHRKDYLDSIWLPKGTVLLYLSHKKRYVSGAEHLAYREYKFLYKDQILRWFLPSVDANDYCWLPKMFEKVDTTKS